MTAAKTAPSTAPVIACVMGAGMVAAIAVATAMPALNQQLVDLSSEQLAYIRDVYWLGAFVTCMVLGVALVVGLRGVSGAAAEAELPRRRVLRLPVRFAGLLVLVGGGLAVAATLWRLYSGGDPGAVAVGIGMTATALIGFLAVPLYIVMRAALRPHALFFARENLPTGTRAPIGALVGYTVLAIAAVALAPAAVLGDGRLADARLEEAQQRAKATARRIAIVASERTPAEAVRLCSRTHLEHALVLLRMPSGRLVPEERGAEIAGAPTEEAPLAGALRGGAIVVAVMPPSGSRAPLIIVAFALVGLAFVIAASLARSLGRDTRAVAAQVEALADDRMPPVAPTVTVSEVRRVAQALNRLLERIPRIQLEKFLAVERAEESRRMKSMFLANMSHDLRSPLNSILGFSELLTRGLEGPITDPQRRILAEINATGSYLLRLLSEILDMARAESGHLDLDRKPAPPATLITQARKEALRGRPEAIGDRMVVDLQAGLDPIRVDVLRMQQALTHVLNWAIDAAGADGTVRVEIAERDSHGGRALVFDVRTGKTVNVDELSAMFQPFRKVEGIAGLHLALPLARRIIEAHGGQIEPLGAAARDSFLSVRITLPRPSVC